MAPMCAAVSARDRTGHRQTFAAFGAATLEDVAATARAHALPEAMLIAAFAIAWLKSAFHGCLSTNGSVARIRDLTEGNGPCQAGVSNHVRVFQIVEIEGERRPQGQKTVIIKPVDKSVNNPVGAKTELYLFLFQESAFK